MRLFLAPEAGPVRCEIRLLAGAPTLLVRTIVIGTSNAPGMQRSWEWFVREERENLCTAAAIVGQKQTRCSAGQLSIATSLICDKPFSEALRADAAAEARYTVAIANVVEPV